MSQKKIDVKKGGFSLSFVTKRKSIKCYTIFFHNPRLYLKTVRSCYSRFFYYGFKILYVRIDEKTPLFSMLTPGTPITPSFQNTVVSTRPRLPTIREPLCLCAVVKLKVSIIKCTCWIIILNNRRAIQKSVKYINNNNNNDNNPFILQYKYIFKNILMFM